MSNKFEPKLRKTAAFGPGKEKKGLSGSARGDDGLEDRTGSAVDKEGIGLALVVSNDQRSLEDNWEGEDTRVDEEIAHEVRPRIRSKSRPQVRVQAKRSLLKVLLLSGGMVGFLALAVITGILVYHQARQKRVQEKLSQVRAMVALDSAVAYSEASQVLAELYEEKPDCPEILVARAEVEAVRWGRFDGGGEAAEAAKKNLELADRQGADKQDVMVVSAYLLLFRNKYEAAAAAAEKALVHYPRSARFGYIMGVARFMLGDLEAAEATLRLAVSNDKNFLPAIYELAVVQRLRGRLVESEALLKKVLEVSPRHLGAKIETVLVHDLMGREVDIVSVERLARRVESMPKYAARAYLLMGRLKLSDGGKNAVAVAERFFEKAAAIRPQEPEYLLELLALHLRPGGDVVRAKRTAAAGLDSVREYPVAPLLQARLALAEGDSGRALTHLSGVRFSSLGSLERAWVKAVGIKAHLENNDVENAKRMCSEFIAAGGDLDVFLKVKGGGGFTVSSMSTIHSDSPVEAGGREQGADVKAGKEGGSGRSMPESKREFRKILEACALYAYDLRDWKTARVLEDLVKDSDLKIIIRGIRYALRHQPLRAWNSMEKIRPADIPDFGHLVGRVLQEIGRPRAALAFFDAKHNYEAQGAGQRLDLAEAYFKAGEAEAARKLLVELDEMEPVSPRILYDRGRLALEMGDSEDAGRVARQLKRDYADSHLGYYLEGLLHLDERQWRMASEAFDAALERKPDCYKCTEKLAQIAMVREGIAGARLYYQRAYKESGRNPEVLANMARRFAETGGDSHAIKAYMNAARGFRKAGSGYRASELYSELAEQLSHNKNYNRSRIESIYKRALKYRRPHPLAYYRWAEYLRRRGKPEEAVRWYERAANAAPESPDVHYSLAWILIRLDRNPSLALQSLKRFDEFEKDTARARRAMQMRRRLLHRMQRKQG